MHMRDLGNTGIEVSEISFGSVALGIPYGIGVKDAADLARKLTGVVTAVPSTLAAPEVRRKAVDEAGLNRLFDELDFGGMLRQRCLRS